VDAGFKAFSTDKPFVPELKEIPGVNFRWAGDEHGILELKEPGRKIQLGDRLEFIPPHCDPTVNLYDFIYVVRGDRVEEVWPVEARGRSQ
jgi:D-serine deaminase-like pyridoxal phosphate-dependent protein